SNSDIAHVQALYGARQDDAFDLKADNDTPDTATQLSVPSGGPSTFDADLTTRQDVDYYQIRLPRNATGATIPLHVSGLSLLAGRLPVAGADTSPVTAAGPGQDVERPVSSPSPGHDLLVRVDSLDRDFAVGGYQLEVVPLPDRGPSAPPPPAHAPSGQAPVVNLHARAYPNG